MPSKKVEVFLFRSPSRLLPGVSGNRVRSRRVCGVRGVALSESPSSFRCLVVGRLPSGSSGRSGGGFLDHPPPPGGTRKKETKRKPKENQKKLSSAKKVWGSGKKKSKKKPNKTPSNFFRRSREAKNEFVWNFFLPQPPPFLAELIFFWFSFGFLFAGIQTLFGGVELLLGLFEFLFPGTPTRPLQGPEHWEISSAISTGVVPRAEVCGPRANARAIGETT